jgi:hypothetical protein
MPFSSQEISEAGKIGLDHYLKNNPVDQVALERVFYKTLMQNKRTAPGAKQYIVEQLRYRYQSNFMWFNGSGTVTFNRRTTIEQAQYAWRSAHDGVSLDEDRLIQNGITVSDSGPGGNATDAEMLQLTNLLEETMEVLRLGFEEQFSYQCHLDGTVGGSDSVTGLDALVSLTPTTGTVGTIDRSVAANAWWRNHAATGLTTTTTTGDIITKMEIAWRACVRNGGKPNKIIIGSTFNDGYRDFNLTTYGTVYHGASGERIVEGGTKGLTFHGVDMEWAPEFADLDGLYAPSTPWEKRCYFLNMRHMKLRPMQGQDMVSRKPPRPYDRYEWYWAITWRGAITMNRSNAMAALAVA